MNTVYTYCFLIRTKKLYFHLKLKDLIHLLHVYKEQGSHKGYILSKKIYTK